MSGFNLVGLWSLEESFATRMYGIMQPRLAAGKDPLIPSLMTEHPAKQIQAALATSGRNVIAGTASYYEYVASQYTQNGVCVLPIIGTLTRYGLCNWGYEDLAGLMQSADRLDSVKVHLLKIDSGGGAVDGLRAFADVVRACKKPVLVWTNFCASAAYFIASQATEIWLEESPLPVIGSIGTLMIYEDRSQALENEGIKIEIFRATESVDKARANGIEPLSDEDRAEIQEILDACQGEFKGYVRRGRAGKLTSDEWISAKMFGTTKGLRIGLADRKGTFQQAFQRATQLAA